MLCNHVMIVHMYSRGYAKSDDFQDSCRDVPFRTLQNDTQQHLQDDIVII